METIAIVFHVLFWVAIAIALIYLIIRRINIKEKEDFDKREN